MKKCPKRITHIVLKKSDLAIYLPKTVCDLLSVIQNTVAKDREFDGKNPSPSYIVINTDEPYIEEIVEVLKKHGHWDGWEE